MDFKEVLRQIYEACDSIGVTGNEKAIIESATKIYIAGTMNQEDAKQEWNIDKEEIANFLDKYKDKILVRERLNAHDWNIYCRVIADISLFLKGRFEF